MGTKKMRVTLPRLGKRTCLSCGKPSKELYCDVCGQQQLERVRANALKSHQHGW